MQSRLYKVVDKDNFAGEGPGSTERFITEALPLEVCEVIAAAMNDRFGGDYTPRFYEVVPSDYQLFIFEP